MYHVIPAFPPPFHLCDLSRTVGTFLWFMPGDPEEVPFATSEMAVAWVLGRYPTCAFVLNTMRGFIAGWEGPNVVAMAAVEAPPEFSVTARVRVLGFVIGGLVPHGTEIPDGHSVADGCIPFDLAVWPPFYMNLPTEPPVRN